MISEEQSVLGRWSVYFQVHNNSQPFDVKSGRGEPQQEGSVGNWRTKRAPEYLDTIIVLALDGLLAGIKLLTLVNIVAAGITSPEGSV